MATMSESAEPSDAEIDGVIAEFDGDLRAALRALLHDFAVLALDRALTVSRGYVRGRWLNDPVELGPRLSESASKAKAGHS